ncbi:superoxide dismutase [Cu-Zn] [Elysia marginata]|uniref:Superoxide dismutase [Cu-Zn] n=1 Tax=Elysia marginata TaxID=1093978 RepID=A0AAV4ISU0_9GAST|nr:superoxide dismutase [Cu-Zn] [Elysia marginata]
MYANFISLGNMYKVVIFFVGASICVCEELRATCTIQNRTVAHSDVKGVVSFYQECEDDDIVITVKIEGLAPLAADSSNLKHGFHIHEWGDITSGCISTGGHYNPLGEDHGAPKDKERHVGDFGNLKQTKDGRIDTKFRDPVASMYGQYSIIGRAIVVSEHFKPMVSWPTRVRRKKRKGRRRKRRGDEENGGEEKDF